MNINTLNKLLIILTVLSLFTLFLITLFFKPPTLSLLEDNTKFLEKVVSVSGEIKGFDIKENNLFFSVCNFSKCLPVVYFSASKRNQKTIEDAYLEKKQIKITGKLTTYNGNNELILYKYDIK